MPLFAVWSESVLYVASKETASKSRNLVADGRCVITTDAGDMHLIVEREAQRVRNEATLRRASDAFNSIYDWPTVVTEDKLDAEFGAPTSGGPPYDVYESGSRLHVSVLHVCALMSLCGAHPRLFRVMYTSCVRRSYAEGSDPPADSGR